MNLPVIVTSAILLCSVAQSGDARHRSLFRAATRNLPGETRRFLCEKRCTVTATTKREEGGPSRWTMGYFRCDNTDPEVISTVICDRSCVNPVTCKRMRKYVNTPVTFGFPVRNRDNSTRIVQLPVACACKLRRKQASSTCRGRNGNRTD